MHLTGVSTISKKYQKRNTLTLGRLDQSMAAPILLGILFFFVLCLGAPDSIKGTVMAVAVFTLFIIAVRFKILRDRIHVPFIALTLVVIMDGISTFYAVSGKFALREFLKVFLAYLMAVILLATSSKREEITGKRIVTILAVCTAFASIIGIDMVSTGWISGAVVWILTHFSKAYEELGGVQIFSTGYRMTSLFSNANVYSGIAGIGILLSLGLTDTSTNGGERCFDLALLYLNTVAFALTLSFGAYFFAFIAIIVFTFLRQRERRLQMWIVIFEMAVFVTVTIFLLYKATAFPERWHWINPLCILILGTTTLCFADLYIVQRITIKTSGNRMAVITICIACAVLFVGYVVAALTVTSEMELKASSRSTSVLFPRAGEYSLVTETDGDPVTCTIYSQSLLESASRSRTDLFSGNVKEASFTIPEESIAIFFSFRSAGEANIYSASYGGCKIPLRYRYLPQILESSLAQPDKLSSVTQRIVYFKDGIKLFRRSPVFGLGIGAFENGIKSVQTFYYETKYAHNHYFQTMLETGIVGTILFLFLLLSSAIAIWKSRKEQQFAPMLGAVWVFMTGQAVHDIVFSANAYLPLAYGSFLLIDFCCGEYLHKPKLTKTVETITLCVIAVCSVIYCGFLAGNMMAKRNADRNPTLQTLTQCVKLDRFEWADYALPYVINATGDNVNVYVQQQAEEYAERLAQVNSNTIPIYLAEYYFSSKRMEQGIAMVEKYVDYIASDQKAWQTAFQLLQAYDDGSETFHSGVIHIAEKLDTWNSENTGTIALDETAMAFIESCKA